MSAFYFFYVNRGYLVALDYEVSLKTVRHLQKSIHEATGVGISDQVLLTGCGTTLEPNKRVGSYPDVGTVSRPVFLFARSTKLEKDELSVSQQRDEVLREILSTREQGESYIHMKDQQLQYQRITEHASVCVSIAESTVHSTARIVQEHHNLNGGWTSLISNLNETMIRLERKQKRYLISLNKLKELKEKTKDLFEGYAECIQQLKQMKLPPSIQPRLMTASTKELSLYEWISATDPNNSLEDLVAQVRDQLEQLNDADNESIQASMRSVVESYHSVDCREIRGINKRITQIEYTLETLNGDKDAIVKTAHSIQHHDPRGVHIPNAYERLHYVHMTIVVFEEKFLVVKQRLDLIRQIKEAPLMFATCITEIMRRMHLQKEFRSWHSAHNERCLTFFSEENQLRSVFVTKLEKHFLRVIFQGMFDKLPVFFVKHVPDFDQHLPVVETEYYRELRKCFGSLDSLLQVNTPQLKKWLFRREESFISYDQAANLTTNLNIAFPSNAWLLDEGMDMSPSTEPVFPGMMQPAGAEPRPSLVPAQRLQSLVDMQEEAERPASLIAHSLKSAPISIPINGPNRREVEDMNESRFSVSPESRRDSREFAKDDKEEQFPVDDISTKSQMLEVLRPMAVELFSLNKNLADTRADLLVYKDRFQLDIQSVVSTAVMRFSEILVMRDVENEREMSHAQDKMQSEIDEANEIIRSLKDERSRLQEDIQQRDSEISSLRQDVQQKNERIAQLTEEAAAFEERLTEEVKDTFKRLTIENELANDRQSSEFQQLLEEKNTEMHQLQKELEKKRAECEQLKNGPQTESFRKVIEADTRATLEREFKTRIDLLSKGFEQKKEEAVARKIKDVEFDHKQRERELEEKVCILSSECDELRSAMGRPPNVEYAENATEDFQSADALLSPCSPMEASVLAVSVMNLSSAAPTHPLPIKEEESEDSKEDDNEQMKGGNASSPMTRECSEEELLSKEESTSRAAHSQTTLAMRSMDYMVSLNDIREGMTVLVVWDDRHDSYILFCISNYIHFVKETSVRRLGLISKEENAPRKNWVLAKVAHVDLCIIKKSTNRYKLPVDTQVYRVDVQPVHFESSTKNIHMSSGHASS